MMNRQERRVAKVGKVGRIIAVHEAGHAVGRLLTAKDMGYSLHQAVHSIEVGGGPDWLGSDGLMELRSQAICYGPAMSLELHAALRGGFRDVRSMKLADVPDFLSRSGVEIAARRASAQAKLLIIAMGPAAEARETQHSWETVFNDIACVADREACWREARIAGFSDDEFADVLRQVRSKAEEYLAMPGVWRAVDAVARNLKKTLSGQKIAQLAAPHLAPLLARDFGMPSVA